MAFVNSIPTKPGPDTIFARIRPSNDHAIKHFHEVAESMVFKLLKHQKNFVRINLDQVQLGKAPGHSQRWVNWSPSINPDLARLVYTGEFVLYLRPDPPIRHNKWRIGGVHYVDAFVYERGETVSDLLLWDKDEPPEEYHEAEFAFNKSSGILTLRGRCDPASKSVILDNDDASNSTRLLNEHSHKLQFGRCEYSFQYEFGETSPYEYAFQQDKTAFFSQRLKIGPPIFWTSATPTISFPKVKDWVIHRNVASGVAGAVRAASKSPPQFAAIKTMVRSNDWSAKVVSHEIETAVHVRTLLKNKPCPFILKLIEPKYDRDQEEWDGKSPEQVHLIYTPLCNQTFFDLVTSQAAWPEDRLSLLHDVIQGLEWLHSNDLVHRDIKLANLGIVLYPKPRAVILDFGWMRQGTKNIAPQQGGAGTTEYMAPEIESRPYDEKVDIWSLGIVAYQMFVSYNLPWMAGCFGNPWKEDPIYASLPVEDDGTLHFDEAWADRCIDYTIAMGALEEGSTTDVRSLIRDMLRWEVEERPSAQDCSRHQCFASRAGNAE
jgi:hypothetical protein